MRPGQRLVDSVTLTNYSDTPITLELAAVDAYNTADDGAFTLHKPDDEPQDVGAWVRLPVDRWTIAPRSSTDFDFELAVPENVRPGDHAGGILSLALTASEPDEGEGVAVRKGVGVRIYARVLGEMAPAVLVDQMHTSHGTPWAPFTTSDASVSFRITNTGNVVVAPNIRLEANSPLGALDSADLGPTQELLPGNSIVVTHQWSGVPAGGPVKQRVIVNGEGYEFTSSSTFWVIPWWLIPVVMGVVVLARWLRRRLPRRAATAIAGATLLIALLALPARAAESPQLMLATNATAVGETMRVSGRGWDSRSNVVVELCGSLAIGGASTATYAAAASSRSAPTAASRPSSWSERFRHRARASSGYAQSRGREQVVASVDVDGVASVPVPSAAPAPATTTAEVPVAVPVSDRSSGAGRPIALGIAAGSATAGILCAALYMGRRRRTEAEMSRAEHRS